MRLVVKMLFVMLMLIVVATGCGGGGDDEGEPSNSAPDARAGIDQTVVEGTAVTLDGSASTDSDGAIVSYTWSQVSGPPINLSGANSVRATFQAPEVDADTALVFQVQVEDDDGATATDRLSVTVTDVPAVAPDARAGINQTVVEGTVVTLDGSASTDSDGTIVSYTWSQVSGPPVDISDANSVWVTFQAPEVDDDTTLVFQVQVKDDDGATAADRVHVTVTDVPDVPVVELTLSVFGEGTVHIVGGHDLTCDVPHACHAFIPQNTDIVLKALPMAGYAIDNWTGCNSVSGDECTVVTDQDKLVSVDFLSTAPLQLKDDVVVFDADRVDQIEDFDLDTGLMVMSADADLSDLYIGDVIVSNVIDSNREFNTYFLRRIRDIQKLPSGVGYIRTIDATLEDLIASGSLSMRRELSPADVTSYELPEGVRWIGPAPGSPALGRRGGASRDVAVAAPQQIQLTTGIEICHPNTTDPDFCVTGSVALTIKPTFVLDVGVFRGLKEFKMEVLMTPSANLTVNTSAGVEFFDRTYDLPLKFHFGAIAVGPVVITPVVTPKLKITVAAGVDFEPTVKVGVILTGGVHYKKGFGWMPIGKFEPMFKADIGEDALNVNSGVQADFIAEFATLIYGSAGPLVTAGPYVGIEAFTLQSPPETCSWDWDWYYGVKAGFGGKLKVLKWGWEYNATLIDIRRTPSSGQRDCQVDEEPPNVVDSSALEFSNVSDNGLTLKWPPSIDDSGDVGYEIQRCAFDVCKVITFVEEPTLHDTGLWADTSYCYYVTAIDQTGNRSESSQGKCVRTASRDTEPPKIPHGVKLEVLSPSTISVSWDASTDDVAVTHYVVFEWPESGTDPTAVTSTKGLSAKVGWLNPGTEYCFGVSAVDKSGNFSDFSDTDMVCATTLEASAAAWRFLIACSGRDYNFEEPFDLVEDRDVSVISITAEGNDYSGEPLAYALTGTYTSQDMMIRDGRIDWSFESGFRRVDTFMADLSTDDTGDIRMEQLQVNKGCDAVIRFTMERDSQGSRAGTVVSSSRAAPFSGATISGH